jgi:hypothetical protein
MSSRARSWLTAAVAAMLLAGLAVLAAPRIDDAQAPPPDTLAEPTPTATTASAQPRAGMSRGRAVREMLDRRATAVRERDEAAFMASVDPKAKPEFVKAQRALFANLDGVPLTEWSYDLDAAVQARPPARFGDPSPLWAPKTTLRYGLKGADATPTTRPLGYLYVQREDGQWYLASDDELGPDGDRTWRGPWDFGPCTAVPAASGLVLGHRGQEGLLSALAAELDSSVRAVTSVWGTDWAQRVAVILPNSTDEMRELVGPAFAVDGIAAAAIADKVDLERHTATGQRVVLNPTQAGRLSESARRIVLRHELTHIAARGSTVDGAPMWLLEGFADYVGYSDSGLGPREAAPDLVRAVHDGGLPSQLPADADFRGASENLDLAYQLAWSAALYVADRAGEDGLVRLYREIAGAPHPDAAAVEAGIRDVLGTDLAGFVDGWRASLLPRFG